MADSGYPEEAIRPYVKMSDHTIVYLTDAQANARTDIRRLRFGERIPVAHHPAAQSPQSDVPSPDTPEA
jgi:hypothetical protein